MLHPLSRLGFGSFSIKDELMYELFIPLVKFDPLILLSASEFQHNLVSVLGFHPTNVVSKYSAYCFFEMISLPFKA